MGNGGGKHGGEYDKGNETPKSPRDNDGKWGGDPKDLVDPTK